MQTVDGKLVVIGGKSRSGKTAYTAKRVKNEKRVIAWDIEAQWCELPGWKKITTRRGLLEAVKKPGAAKIAYVVGGDIKAEFDFWCGCVMYWGRYCGPCSAIPEELADVTTPSKAPGNWGILVRRGLKRGITLYPISQRWAEADKTCIGNATEFVCFAMEGDDIEYMAKKTRIPVDDLLSLKMPSPDNPVIEWVRSDRQAEKIERGKIVFPRKK